jgi:hypothetical protein
MEIHFSQFWRVEVQDQETNSFGVWCGPSPVMTPLVAAPHAVEDLHPSRPFIITSGGQRSYDWTVSPKTPPLNTVVGIRWQHELWKGPIQTMALTFPDLPHSPFWLYLLCLWPWVITSPWLPSAPFTCRIQHLLDLPILQCTLGSQPD